jgi:hypothetical protein
MKKRVRLVSDERDGPTAGTHEFEPLEFLALLLAHVPDRHEILVRYSGVHAEGRARRGVSPLPPGHPGHWTSAL